MSKYDFGYELEQGSTNKWAFEMVEKKCCRVYWNWALQSVI